MPRAPNLRIGETVEPRTTPWPLALWRGQVPLGRAFWRYALGYGTLANGAATLAALGAISAEWPAWLGMSLFLAPTPYYVLAVTGVWRSADQRVGLWPLTARTLVLVWAGLVVLI